MPGQAINTFHHAVSTGYPLAERSLCALLSAFLKAGELDRTVEAFNNIPKQLNLTPGLVPHNILLRILCKKGYIAATRKLLDIMSNTDCAKPHIISYPIVLDRNLSKDDKAGFAEILDEIDRAGLVASVVTYNCRIAFFCLFNRLSPDIVSSPKPWISAMTHAATSPSTPTPSSSPSRLPRRQEPLDPRPPRRHWVHGRPSSLTSKTTSPTLIKKGVMKEEAEKIVEMLKELKNIAIYVSRDDKSDQTDERLPIEDAGGFVMWAGT